MEGGRRVKEVMPPLTSAPVSAIVEQILTTWKLMKKLLTTGSKGKCAEKELGKICQKEERKERGKVSKKRKYMGKV